ncbi:MAG: SOS response-associated peptidase [Actinomycetota bacterium]
MCGRYAASRNPDDLVEEFEVQEVALDPPGAGQEEPDGVAPDWNVAPMRPHPVVLERPPRGEPDAEPTRQLRLLTWGLVPSWAKDRSTGNKMINARAESLLDKPAYRRAAIARRCLVPADGWFEWQASPVVKDAKGKPRKQPFFVRPEDGSVIAFAGVYELWRDPSRDADDPFAWLATYAIVTTDAEPGLDRIHDRMPLVLPRDRWDAWLDPSVSEPDDVRSLLLPAPPGRFVAVPVSPLVNNVRNNGPELVEPLAVDDLVGVVDPATGEVLGGQGEALF